MEKERALSTIQIGWQRIGTIAAATANGASALAVDERYYSTVSVLANAVGGELGPNMNGIEIRFLLSTNNADVDIDIWAARNEDDDMVRVCTLDVVCGQQSDGTNLFADTINISNENWPKKPKAVEPGTDHQARLLFDLCGYRRILFYGYGTFDENCIIEISGY